jgi:cytochrome c551/c552
MKLKSTIAAIFLFTGLFFVIACGSNNSDTTATEPKTESGNDVTNSQTEEHGTEVKEGDIQLTTPLDPKFIAEGKATYELKCQSCHKLTDEKLVGPGWKDVTKRREPVWIMNMITNVEMMLETDPEAQKLLEQCLVRMPNQNVSKEDARELLEYMRSNDGVK